MALAPTVAVIGGGQLARMMAEPAAAMGIPLRLLAEAPGVSAAQVIVDHEVGDYRDLTTLERVVEDCAVVTFDHEHVPTEHLHALESSVAVRPGPHALVYAQDKGLMRERLGKLGVPCPRNAIVASADDVAAFGTPCVLKTTRGGYDGKGVWFVDTIIDADDIFESGATILAEEKVDFVRELSALVARSPSGQVAAYPVVQSKQRDGICAEVIAPAPDLDRALAVEAEALAHHLKAAQAPATIVQAFRDQDEGRVPARAFRDAMAGRVEDRAVPPGQALSSAFWQRLIRETRADVLVLWLGRRREVYRALS